MDIKLILSTQIIVLLIKTTTSQYYGNPYQQQSYQQPYSQPQQAYSQPSYPQQQYFPQQPIQTPIQLHIPQAQPKPTRRERETQRTRYEDYSTDYEDDSYSDKKGSIRNRGRDELDEENDSGTDNNGRGPNAYQQDISFSPLPPAPAIQPNLVLVPYPYALIVPTTVPPVKKMSITITNTTTTTTTTRPTTKPTTQPPKPNRRLHFNEPGIRYRTRNTKPTWIPKYGIVPIPDKLAEKLMSQLRNVKGLRSNVNMQNTNSYSNVHGAHFSSIV